MLAWHHKEVLVHCWNRIQLKLQQTNWQHPLIDCSCLRQEEVVFPLYILWHNKCALFLPISSPCLLHNILISSLHLFPLSLCMSSDNCFQSDIPTCKNEFPSRHLEKVSICCKSFDFVFKAKAEECHLDWSETRHTPGKKLNPADTRASLKG